MPKERKRFYFSFKTTSVVLFFLSIILSTSTKTLAQETVVDWEQEPLFSDINLIPGDTTKRWIKVTNNSDRASKVGVRAESASGDEGFFEQLLLQIKDKDSTEVLFDGTFSDLLVAEGEEIFLSPLSPDESVTYLFTVTFSPKAGNLWQGKTARYNLIIGFIGEEGKVRGIEAQIGTASPTTKKGSFDLRRFLLPLILTGVLIFILTLYSHGRSKRRDII